MVDQSTGTNSLIWSGCLFIYLLICLFVCFFMYDFFLVRFVRAAVGQVVGRVVWKPLVFYLSFSQKDYSLHILLILYYVILYGYGVRALSQL